MEDFFNRKYISFSGLPRIVEPQEKTFSTWKVLDLCLFGWKNMSHTFFFSVIRWACFSLLEQH